LWRRRLPSRTHLIFAAHLARPHCHSAHSGGQKRDSREASKPDYSAAPAALTTRRRRRQHHRTPAGWQRGEVAQPPEKKTRRLPPLVRGGNGPGATYNLHLRRQVAEDEGSAASQKGKTRGSPLPGVVARCGTVASPHIPTNAVTSDVNGVADGHERQGWRCPSSICMPPRKVTSPSPTTGRTAKESAAPQPFSRTRRLPTSRLLW